MEAMEAGWQEGRQMGPQLPGAARRQQPYLPSNQAGRAMGGEGGFGDASFIGGANRPGPQAPGQLMRQPQPQQKKQRQSKSKSRAADKKSEIQHKLAHAWTEQWEEMQATTDFRRGHILPLARIKKIMKIDEDVRMISAEAPIVFGKACELFIIEMTMRAWQQTEQAKRRTLQRTDVRSVVMDVDVMDFLIDIVPEEEPKPAKKEEAGQQEDAGEQNSDQQPQSGQQQVTATGQMAPQDLSMQIQSADKLVPEAVSYEVSSNSDSRVSTVGDGDGRVNEGPMFDGFGSVPR